MADRGLEPTASAASTTGLAALGQLWRSWPARRANIPHGGDVSEFAIASSISQADLSPIGGPSQAEAAAPVRFAA